MARIIAKEALMEKWHPVVLRTLLRSAVTCLILCTGLPTLARSAEIHLTSETYFRYFERNTAVTNNAAVAPFYEYLQGDVGALKAKGLSFHLYGWGRMDLAGNGYYSDDSDGELLYGYLEYTGPMNNFDLKLGRQYVFAGVANESVDGLRIQTDLTPYFTLSAYGGQPVALDSTDGRSGDGTWGARIANHWGSLYNLGVSYKQVFNDGTRQEEKLGIDLFVLLPFGANLTGFSSRNMKTGGWGEHSYAVRFVVAGIRFRPFFERFEYDNYFATGVNTGSPFVFLPNGQQTLTDYGADVTWRKSEAWEFGLRGKGYDYDQGDSSAYFSGLLTWYGPGSSRIGGELGYMNGGDERNRYLLVRSYVYWDQLVGPPTHSFVTGDLVYAYYDRGIFQQHSALYLSFGGGTRYLKDALEIKISGDYGTNPYFDDDLRGMLVAKYTFDR